MTNKFGDLVDYIRNNVPLVALLNVACGLSCGMVIAVPAQLIQYQFMLANCASALTQAACDDINSSPSASCAWDSKYNVCYGADKSVCDTAWSAAQCKEHSTSCEWVDSRGRCEQFASFGWSNSATGFFASAAVCGAIVGAIVSAATARHDQMKRIGQFCAAITVGTVIAWVIWAATSRTAWTSVGFVVAGVGFGGHITLAPAVVSSVVAPSVRSLCGTLFQLSITTGIAVGAFISLCVQSFPSAAPHVLLAACAVSGVGAYYVEEAIAAPLVAHAMSESNNGSGGGGAPGAGGGVAGGPSGASSVSGGGAGGAGPAGVSGGGAAADATAQPTAAAGVPTVFSQPVESSGPPSLGGGGSAGAGGGARDPMSSASSVSSDSHLVAATAAAGQILHAAARALQNRQQTFIITCYIAGFVLGTSIQISGINAVMAFAGKMTAAAGVSNPITGNFVIMLWNALSCLPAIPLANRYTAQTLYIYGMSLASGCCILTSIAMYFGSSHLALLCICAFIFFFEAAGAPFFYALVTEIYPPSVRSTGVSVVQFANFFGNLYIVAAYPALCDWMMPAGGADKAGGVRRVFMLYGFLGLGSIAALHALFPHTYLSARAKSDSDAEPSSGNGGSGSSNNHNHSGSGSNTPASTVGMIAASTAVPPLTVSESSAPNAAAAGVAASASVISIPTPPETTPIAPTGQQYPAR